MDNHGTEDRYSLFIGGPFWDLLRRFGLLGSDCLPHWKAALIFSAVAWIPPALLDTIRGLAWIEALGERSFLLDFGSYARFIISIIMLVIMERKAEERGAKLIRHFENARLIRPEERNRFMSALQDADNRTNSAVAEAISFGLAYVITIMVVLIELVEMQQSWLGSSVKGQYSLTLAGWWALLVSLPLYWFLLLRWFWRFIVFTRLLRNISKLDLRLIATHPDRSGGIGFLGIYPTLFLGLVFALSCVTAAAGLQTLLYEDWSLRDLALPYFIWIVVMFIVFFGPLALFSPTLQRERLRSMLAYDVASCQHNRFFEQKSLHPEKIENERTGENGLVSLSDLNAADQAVREMRVFPATSGAFMSLLVAASLPWLAILLMKVPAMEIFKVLMSVIL